MTNKVVFNGGTDKNQRTFGYERTEVLFSSSGVGEQGFWLPFGQKFGVGGLRLQNRTNVPVKVDMTLDLQDADITADPTAKSIWAPLVSSLAVLDTSYVMPPFTGFKVTLVPAAAKVITAMSWAGGVVTATSTAHGFVSNSYLTIAGVTPAGYNGVYLVTVVDANTFTYGLVADPGIVTVQGTARVKGTGIVQFLST